MSGEVVLEFVELSHSYENATGMRVVAVSDVTLRVTKGERIAFVGANGAGKTTLLLLATGAIAASQGRVEVLARRVERRSLDEVRRRLAYVFADPDHQIICATVLDEVCFGLLARGVEASAARQLARSALANLSLDGVVDRDPMTLSLGEKKKLTIATALVLRPDIYLFDEPTANLDPRARKSLLALMQKIDGTVVIATHDLDAALALDARVVVVSAGRVIADGRAERILRDRALLESCGLELPLSVAGSMAPAEELGRTPVD